MPNISVQHCLRNFEDEVSDALSLLSEADNYGILQPDGRYYKLGSRRKELFAAIALLRIHLAWEDYIESVFVRYMCGAKAASGFSPTLIITRCSSITGAMSVLLGRNSYLNWSPYNIEIRARQFFDRGEPFVSTIIPIRNTLHEVNTIRNRFAHRSSYSIVEFDNVVSNLLGYLPRGINSGRLLLMDDPSYPIIRLIDRYSNILLVSARNLAP